MAFVETWNYLIGRIPRIEPFLARTLVQDAWTKVCESKDNWSFLAEEFFPVTPAAIYEGTVDVTRGSTTVTPDATALSAWTADDPTGRQFRIGDGPLYDIASFDGSVITLRRAYTEATATDQAYTIRGIYIVAPENFGRWETMLDVENQYKIYLDATLDELNEADASRSASDDPTVLVAHSHDPVTKRPRYEFWPHPALVRCYPSLVWLKRRPYDDTNDLPQSIPATLINDAAMIEAYAWAEANRSRYTELAGADWRFLLDRAQKKFNAALVDAKRDDTNIFNSNFGPNYLKPWGFGYSADYLQAHAPWRP